MKAKQKFLVGTAIQITTFISVATATSAKIKIVDSGGVVQVDNADMSADAPSIYSYIYQSKDTDTCGDCVTTISVASGGYTAVAQDMFTLESQA